MGLVVKLWKLLNFFRRGIVVNGFRDAVVEVGLKKEHFPFVGRDDGPQILDGFEEFGILREMVDPIRIEDHDFVLGDALDEEGEKFIHVGVSAEARSDHPSMDCFFPRLNLLQPFLYRLLLLSIAIDDFLRGSEHGVHDDLGRVGFDGR